MFHVSTDLKKHVNELFGKSEEQADADVQNIKKWIESQPHLPEIMDEVKIRNMLNLCKFNMEKTKQKIDSYYSVRGNFPSLFDSSNPKLPEMQKALKNMNLCTHPELVEGLYRVTFIRSKTPNSITPKDVFLWYTATLEVRLQADFMVNEVVIADMCNFSIKDLWKTTISSMINVLRAHKAVYSLRIKNMYFINSPTYASLFIKTFQFLIPRKIADRVKVYSNSEVLKDLFPETALPKDYGGKGPSLDELNDMMKEKIEEFQDRFDLLDRLRVNESLRPKN